MNPQTLRQASDYHRRRRRKQRWRKIVTVMAAIVVFCTTYALILPAITLEQEAACGVEEHTHTDACYTVVPDVTESALVCEDVSVEHVHSDGCYQETRTISCSLTEHTHTDMCYVSEAVRETIALIDVMPSPEEAEQELAAFEAADDWESYEAYYKVVAWQGKLAYEAYSALSEDEQADVTNADKLMELAYIWSPTTLAGLDAFTNGSLEFSYNYQKDAFIHDSAYAQFYNADSPLGTAGSFHIVAFDTAYLYVHTNGNILAKNLVANSNFGTNSKGDQNLIELTYVQNYLTVNSNSAADVEDYLVIGTDHNLTLVDNNNAIAINGTKIDKPDHIIQDDDTATAPFIDLVRVENEIKSIAAVLANYESNVGTVLNVTTTGDNPAIELLDKDAIGIYNLTAAELTTITNHGRGFAMKGFESDGGGAIIINVDCRDWDRTQTLVLPDSLVSVDGVVQSPTETLDFSAGRVVWNFVNAADVKIETAMMTGMVVAPDSDLDLNKSFNGTAIGNNVENHSETHRTDFMGKILPTENLDTAHIYVYKVDAENYGHYLSGAEFTLYEWNGSAWQVASSDSESGVHITDSSGQTLFDGLTYNKAYQLVETKAPIGYKASAQPLYFYFESDDTAAYPVIQPDGFTGSSVSESFIHYCPNEATDIDMTSLQIHKQWVASDGSSLSQVPWDSIDIEVWYTESVGTADADGNMVYGSPGEEILYGTYTVKESDGWLLTVSDLPVTSGDLTVKYDYIVKEAAMDGCQSSVTDDGNGVFTVTNTVDVETSFAPLMIQKQWFDSGVIHPPDGITQITLQLWRVSKTDADAAWGSAERIRDDIVVTAANNWTWSAADEELIAQKTIGNITTYYAYYVVETPVPDGYLPDYGGADASSPVDSEQNWTIGISNNKIETTSLTVQKVWEDADGNPLTDPAVDSIQVQVQQSSDGGTTWTDYGDVLSVTADGGWTATVSNLPLKDPASGVIYTYIVRELEVDNFTSAVAVNADGTFVITNTEDADTTKIRVEKQWFKNGQRITHNSGSVTVNLYQLLSGSADSGGSSSSSETATVGIYIDQWYHAGTGAVYQDAVTVPIGSTLTFVMRTPNATPSLGYGSASASWSTTALTPVASVEDGTNGSSTMYKVTYEYVVSGDIDLLGYVGVNDTASCSFEVITEQAAPAATLRDTAVLSPDNAWGHTFGNLPLYEYDASGNVVGYYSYYVEESDGDRFSVAYTDQSGNVVGVSSPVTDGTVLVKNTIPEDAYTLPDTGGEGHLPYMAVGCAFLFGAIGLMYKLYKCRKKGGNV